MIVKKYIKPVVFVAVFALLAVKSVYFKKLSEVRNAKPGEFDAVAFTKKLWDEKLPARLDSAVSLPVFIQAVASDPDQAFARYSNTLAIGNYRYALVRADAVVKNVKEDEFTVELPVADSLLLVNVATEFVYGNALRDASKLLEVKDFPNTSDLNSISEQLNNSVRKNVIGPVKQSIKIGDSITVTGAVEINKSHIHWKNLEIIPARLQIKH